VRFAIAALLCVQLLAPTQTGTQLKPVQQSTPDYPSESMALDALATVVVKTTIAPAGAVIRAETVRWRMRVDRWVNDPAVWAGHPEQPFIAVAEDAARHWTFAPIDAETSVELSFDFRLSQGGAAAGNANGPWNGIEDRSTPPAHAGRRVMRAGGRIASPRKIVDASPSYPNAATADIRGNVVVELHLAEDGTVADTHVLRSIPALDAAAVAAARQWKFEPAVVDNEPIEMLVIVAVPFGR